MSFFKRWKINSACFRSILTKRPLFAAWHITYKCNCKCRFCNFYKLEDGDILTPDQIKEANDKLVKIGIRTVNFAGGEPYIRKDINQIISKVSPKSIVIINTNGMLVTDEIAHQSWLAGLDVANVSIDFADSEKHDYYRNQKGAWEKAWRGVESFLSRKVNDRQIVTVQAILSSENINEVEKIIQKCQGYNITFAMNPYNPDSGHTIDWNFDQGATEIKNFLKNLKEKYPETFILSDYALEKTHEFIKNGAVNNCSAGKYQLAISASGEIGPCERTLSHSIGNIRNLDYQEIKSRLSGLMETFSCVDCYARERSEIEYAYEPMSLSTIKYLLAEAKT